MYDLIIIGAGPAGLMAAIYAIRYKLKFEIIGKLAGGQMTLASRIENYPGFRKIVGTDLTAKIVDQLKGLGVKIMVDEIEDVKRKDGLFLLTAEGGKTYKTESLIVATGTERRKLNIPGEEKYQGKGVSYCTTCDSAFFKDKIVAVIGGANSAAVGALHLAAFAQKVYIIYRRKPLRADPVWIERVKKNKKIEVVYDTNVTKILGDGVKVTGVEWDKDKKGLEVDGVFIEAGGVPGTTLVKPLEVKLDENGFIKVDLKMATNIPGLFAAGDITSSGALLQQIATACAQGAMAATSVYRG